MLEKITLSNFKGARELDVRLSPLTVLSGLNSAGKSTLLQCLCAVRQSSGGAERLQSLDLYGDLVQLGTFAEVLSHGASEDEIRIGIKSSSCDWHAAFSGRGNSSTLDVKKQIGEVPSSLRSTEFQLLLAERVSPQPRFPRALGKSSVAGRLGSRGEYTADILAKMSLDLNRVDKARHVSRVPYSSISTGGKSSPTDQVVDQVSAWLQEISPGVRVESQIIGQTDDVRLAFNYFGRAGFEETNQRIRPTNVGFGLTYSLPVVLACLIAERGSLLLLENPEAHLHPRGQLYLGFLLALVASDGVQVLVETHSDHVLNGIRLAVKSGIIIPDLVGFRFFSRDISSGDVYVQCPVICQDGSIPVWPEGFFDEWDNALVALLRK